MIRRFYVHNFRCLEHFELPVSGKSSLLLIGKNGAGKTTIGRALEILQKISRGTNRVGELISKGDFTRGRIDVPMRFEIELELQGRSFKYAIAFEFPETFRESRVFEEKLVVDGSPVYTREIAQVRMARRGQDTEATFGIDWHLVALPIVQDSSTSDPLFVFKQWLSRVLILRPLPGPIRGDSEDETLQPKVDVSNLGAWFSGLIAYAPSAYSVIESYLSEVMIDFDDIKNPSTSKDTRSLIVQFSNNERSFEAPFYDLSDGEKCFLIYALVLASNRSYGPLLCFWDEPDNHLAPSEVGQSVMALRRSFESKGQLIVTSHDPEAIRQFSDENTVVLHRNSHLEPTNADSLDKLRNAGDLSGNLVDAIIRGDVAA